MAIGQAFRAVAHGECDLVLTGGAEYLGDPYGGPFRAFDAVGALAAHRGDYDLLQVEYTHLARYPGDVLVTALHRAGEDYDVYAVTDASGGVSSEAHEMAVRRMAGAGVTPGVVVGATERLAGDAGEDEVGVRAPDATTLALRAVHRAGQVAEGNHSASAQ